MNYFQKQLLLLYLLFFNTQIDSATFTASDLNTIVYHKSKETLQKIMSIIAKKEKGAYLRFGDGDVSLAMNRPDSLQVYTHSLSAEMRESFQLGGNNVFKCLILNCPGLGFEPGMMPGKFASDKNHAINLLNEVSKVWPGKIREVYTPTALHFCATDYPQYAIRFLHFLKSCNKKILVVNANLKRGKRLVYAVVIIAMGCSGRALQKRLWRKRDNLFLFDFGSLMDALCGWDTRAWISLSNFDKNQFLKKVSSEIRVISTAALIDEQFEMRKQEYISSCEALHQYGFQPYLLESCKALQTFLNDYSHNVFYTKTNDRSLKNKGVNEALALRAGMHHYKFESNDIIIKLTGRYHLLNDSFICLIEANPTIDVFVKYNEYKTAFTGCFAMRCNYLKNFLDTIDFETMENKMLGIEYLMTEYIKKIKQSGAQIMPVQKLSLKANIFGEGKPQMTYW